MLSLTVEVSKKSWDWLYEPVPGLFCIFAKCVIIFDYLLHLIFFPSPCALFSTLKV